MTTPKILLIQLPLQEVGEVYAAENVPLAGGYLLCALKEAGLDRQVDAGIMDQELMDFAGDAQIVDAVVSQQPDMVGFSCYCWNVERSLYLAKEIKANSPHTMILLGGPEIVGEGALGSQIYDLAVVGEGEGPFVEIVRAYLNGVRDFSGIPSLRIKGGGAPSTASEVISDAMPRNPYLEGYISPSAEGTIFVETVRGCRFSCSYCYYPKNFSSQRCFSAALMRNVFIYARNSGVSEVCILDPSFNTNPNFQEICRTLQEVNHAGTFTLHAELRADFLSESDVELLAGANLKTVELGLQSIHPETLKTIRRPCRIQRWVKGVRMLRERGVKIRCDLILGLPGEDVDMMRRNIEFLAKIGLGDEAQIFHLSLLPGTDLRKNASRYGIRYQKTPPYLVIETSAASHMDLAQTLVFAGERLGVEISPVEGGPFLRGERDDSEIFCGEDVLSDPARLEENIMSCRRKAPNRLRIWFKAPDLGVFRDAIVGFVSGIHRDNPYTLLEIILEAEVPFSDDLPRAVAEYATFAAHYINKSHYYIDQTGLRSTMLFALFPLKALTHPLMGTLQGQIGVFLRVPADLPPISPEVAGAAEGFFLDIADDQIDWKKIDRLYKDLPIFFRSQAHFERMKKLDGLEVRD